MSPRYLIRLDDACPTMCAERWSRMASLLERHDVHPLVGVVPANADPALAPDPPDPDFWETLRARAAGGWEIALHGYDHVYASDSGGINPVNPRSEFAGLPLPEQRHKLARAVVRFSEERLAPRVFFAPAHTFDEATLEALVLDTDIRVVSDTVALSPYRRGEILFIPQQVGRARALPIGTVTFCYHPNLMAESDFVELERFLEIHAARFTSVDAVIAENCERSRSLLDRGLAWSYFTYRALRARASGITRSDREASA